MVKQLHLGLVMLNTPKALRTKQTLLLSRETVRSLLSPMFAANAADEGATAACQAPPTDKNASCTCAE